MLGIELPLEDASQRVDAAIVDAVVRRGELDDDGGLSDQQDIDGKRAPCRPLLDGAVRFADGEGFVGDKFKRVHSMFQGSGFRVQAIADASTNASQKEASTAAVTAV